MLGFAFLVVIWLVLTIMLCSSFKATMEMDGYGVGVAVTYFFWFLSLAAYTLVLYYTVDYFQLWDWLAG